jgi:hypothetical protein
MDAILNLNVADQICGILGSAGKQICQLLNPSGSKARKVSSKTDSSVSLPPMLVGADR